MRLFLYGTLAAATANPVAAAAHRHLLPLGPAQASGTLHAIPDPAGWYPALVPGIGPVHGHIFAAQATLDLAALDAYEGPDYCRTEIRLTDGTTAEAWLWQSPLPPGTLLIPHGNFARWLTETGNQAFQP